MGTTQLIKKAIPEDVSKRITSLRWFGIFLVVVMHSFQTVGFFSNYSNMENIELSNGIVFNFFTRLVVQGIGSGAVPMFFLFSGYLDFMRSKPYAQNVKNKFRTLMIPFFLWTAICIGLCFLAKGIIGDVATMQFIYSRSPKDWLCGMFGNYFSAWKGASARNMYFMFQLWYVRDLFILTLIIPAIRWLLQKTPVPFFIAVTSLLMLDIRTVIVGTDAMLFYSLGAAWAMYDFDLLKICDECKWRAIFPIFAFLIWYTAWGEYSITAAWINRIVTLVIILKFSAYIVRCEKRFSAAKYLSEYSFFMFLLHGNPVLLVCFVMLNKIIDFSTDAGLTLAVFLAIIFVSGGCTLIGIALKKICKPLFNILIGGRAK